MGVPLQHIARASLVPDNDADHDMTDAPTTDFSGGIALRDLPDGATVSGRIGAEEAILVRHGETFSRWALQCSHYHGPLAEGLIVDDTVRCPWHHACFSLRTGEALRAPALDPIPCWRVERIGDRVFRPREACGSGHARRPPAAKSADTPASVVIIGGGAAGLAAADMLRREGYRWRRDHDQRRRVRRRATGRICPRTSWRGPRQPTGFRCGRPNTMPSAISNSNSTRGSRRST